MKCDICGANMNAVGHIGVERCPGCGTQYTYDEGIRIVVHDSLRNILKGRDQIVNTLMANCDQILNEWSCYDDCDGEDTECDIRIALRAFGIEWAAGKEGS